MDERRDVDRAEAVVSRRQSLAEDAIDVVRAEDGGENVEEMEGRDDERADPESPQDLRFEFEQTRLAARLLFKSAATRSATHHRAREAGLAEGRVVQRIVITAAVEVVLNA